MSRLRRWPRSIRAVVIAGSLVLAAAGPAVASTPSTDQAGSSEVTLASGSVSPATITGGDGAVQTITLSGPAPAGGLDVWLYGDLVYAASTGGRASVPAGATSVSFPFRVAAPKTELVLPLYAQVVGSPLIKIAQVTILPADPATRAVTALGFSADAAVEGTTVTGTVVLKNPAPDGGITVSLWSNTSYGPSVNVPAYVTVPAGSTSATFPIRVNYVGTPAIVRPSADLGTSLVSRELVVVPTTFAVSSGTLARRGTVTPMAVGIGTSPNPDGATVALESDTAGVTVPASVTIPAGSPGVAFPVKVRRSVAQSTLGHITATWNGASVSGYFVTD
jgi:hypothetical protein